MRKRAFTLVEILISIVILGIGITVMFNIFPLALQSLTYSRRLNQVYFLAQQKLDEIKADSPGREFQDSGQQDELRWSLTTRPYQIQSEIELIMAQLDIEFNFQGRTVRQRFVTYLEE